MSLSDFIAAVEHGAAAIYHDVMETGVAIVNLSTDHPAIAALLTKGATVANGVLRRWGFAGLVVTVVEDDILTSIKALAVRDATVPTARVTAAQSSGADNSADALNAAELAKIQESRV
jgi:hypothetical protein